MTFVINGLSSLIGNSDCFVVSIVKVNYTAVIVKANRYINIYFFTETVYGMYSKFPGFYPHHVNFLRKYLFVYHTGFKEHNLTVNDNMSCHSLAQILAVNQQRKYNSIHKPQ